MNRIINNSFIHLVTRVYCCVSHLIYERKLKGNKQTKRNQGANQRLGNGEPVNDLRIDTWVPYEKLAAAAFYIILARDGDGNRGI